MSREKHSAKSMQSATLFDVTRPVAAVSVRYPVRPSVDAWVVPEGNVAESIPHDAAGERLRRVLEAWSRRIERPVYIARNFAIRWLEEAPQVGIDPDVCVLDPPPPDIDTLGSLCLWKPGHVAPPICFEIVSTNHPYKDYAAVQDRYAAIGTRELVVFDPLLAGPAALGGPVALQVWRRDAVGLFERIHWGDAPAYSEVLDAWLVPRGKFLDLANDREGRSVWRTGEELALDAQQRAEEEKQRAEEREQRAEEEKQRAEEEKRRALQAAERERAAREELEQLLHELRAEKGRR